MTENRELSCRLDIIKDAFPALYTISIPDFFNIQAAFGELLDEA
jgi:hypothetical protein